MKIESFPFQTLDWSSVASEEHNGTTGLALWKIFQMGDIRIRMVSYSANYFADHWCRKGHIIYFNSGTMIPEIEEGIKFFV